MRNEFRTFGDGEISCSSCKGLCCRKGVSIALSRGEAVQIETAGTELRQMDRSEWQDRPGNHHPGFRRDWYELQTDCGNLDQETGLCGDYENRPRVCREVPVGGYGCEVIRIANGYEPVGLGMPTMRPQSGEATV
jgi:Fe-S-cluster containining protein